MPNDDELERALSDAREAQRIAWSQAVAQTKDEHARGIAEDARKAPERESGRRLDALGRSFALRAQAARIPLDKEWVGYKSRLGPWGVKDIYRHCWKVRSYSDGKSGDISSVDGMLSSGPPSPGLYIFPDGSIIHGRLGVDKDSHWSSTDVDEVARSLADYLVKHGA